MEHPDYIISECDRQHAKNYGDFAEALDWAIHIQSDSDFFHWCGVKDMLYIVAYLGNLVEPEKNFYRNDLGTGIDTRIDTFRTSHVGFMHGGNAAPAGEVRSRMQRWASQADSIVNNFYRCSEEDADALVKSLLDIHPFEDGNGRVASILRNLLIGSLEDPQPLPYYYGNA